MLMFSLDMACRNFFLQVFFENNLAGKTKKRNGVICLFAASYKNIFVFTFNI